MIGDETAPENAPLVTTGKIIAVLIRVGACIDNLKGDYCVECDFKGKNVDLSGGFMLEHPCGKRKTAKTPKSRVPLPEIGDDLWRASPFRCSGCPEHAGATQRLGVKCRFLHEPYIDVLGPFADGVISLLTTVAKIERQNLSARAKIGLARACKQAASVAVHAWKRILG